jgi:hypothetical protein
MTGAPRAHRRFRGRETAVFGAVRPPRPSRSLFLDSAQRPAKAVCFVTVLGLSLGLPAVVRADHPGDDGGFPWSLVLSLGIIAAVAGIWIYSALTDRRRPSRSRRR